MFTTTYTKHRLKTGRKLGMIDVFAKMAEVSIQRAIRTRFGARLHSKAVEKPTAANLQSASVRRMADRIREASPAFASDLYAAADRHEILASPH